MSVATEWHVVPRAHGEQGRVVDVWDTEDEAIKHRMQLQDEGTYADVVRVVRHTRTE